MRSTVAKDQPAGPVHVVLVELDGLVVLLLRVGEQGAVDILARRQAEDRLRADSSQLLPRCLGDQIRQFIGPSGGIEPQRQREPRAVTVLGLRKRGNAPFGSERVGMAIRNSPRFHEVVQPDRARRASDRKPSSASTRTRLPETSSQPPRTVSARRRPSAV